MSVPPRHATIERAPGPAMACPADRAIQGAGLLGPGENLHSRGPLAFRTPALVGPFGTLPEFFEKLRFDLVALRLLVGGERFVAGTAPSLFGRQARELRGRHHVQLAVHHGIDQLGCPIHHLTGTLNRPARHTEFLGGVGLGGRFRIELGVVAPPLEIGQLRRSHRPLARRQTLHLDFSLMGAA